MNFPIIGPWKILEKAGSSFRLELPDMITISIIISADTLYKTLEDLTLEEAKWEVEEIIDCCVRGRRNMIEYRVKWIGYKNDPV
ncbi:hypothetical protein FQN49_000012 [Arthroderma sp. PD_2]|nr:hypothetical protein FQN49_000012 [Arthroderma sp. PD_2]